MKALAYMKRPAAGLALALCLLAPAVLVTAALAEEHGEAAHGGGKGIDYAKRVLNFGLFAGGLVYLLRKPVSNFFGGRREQIARQLADLERARDDARTKLQE